MLHPTARSIWLSAAFCALATLSGCSSVESQLARHMERGQEHFAAENYEKARVEFGNALQISPKNAEANYMNGRVAEKLGKIRDAVAFYNEAIEINPDHVQARANVSRVFVFAGAPQQAMEAVEPALAKHPDDADLLVARAAARTLLKDRAGALADAERAVKVSPDNENAIAMLAAIYRGDNKQSQAAELLKAAIARKPKSADLRQVLANLYLTGGDPVLAEQQLAEVVKIKPDVPAYRLQLALLFTRNKQLDEAERALKEGMGRLPDNRDLKLAYVDFLLGQRSREAGENALRDFIAKDPKDFELQLALGGVQERSGDKKAAMATYQQVIDVEKEKPPGLSARNRLAAVHMREGRTSEAEKLVAEVLARNSRDNDALIMRGNLSLGKNDQTSAIADLRAVLRDQPDAVGVMRALARAHLANDEALLAEEHLRKAMLLSPRDTTIRVELAQLLGQTQRMDQAITLLEESVNAAPNDGSVRESLARMYLSAGKLDRARSAAEDLKTLRPDLAVGYYLAGVVATEQKRAPDAQRELARAFELQPSAADVLTALTRLDIAAGNTPVALQRVRAAVERDPTNALMGQLLGEVYMASKDFPAAQKQFEVVVAAAPKWPVPYRNLALLRMMQRDIPGAMAVYQKGVAATDHEVGLVTDLALLNEGQGKADEAIKLYEAVLARNPRQEAAANNLAMTLVTHRKDAVSLDRARDLTEPFAGSNNGLFLDTYGWVRLKRGETAASLAALERAVELMPRSASVRFHLGMAQMQAGQMVKAKTSLKEALATNQKFSERDNAQAALAALEKKAG